MYRADRVVSRRAAVVAIDRRPRFDPGSLIWIAFLLVPAVCTVAQPRIDRLDRSDPVYQQHQQMVAEYFRSIGGGGSAPPLFLFVYETDGEQSIFALAARLMIPYATLATLNRLSGPSPPSGEILVPSQPGLFVYLEPSGSLERTVRDRLLEHGEIESGAASVDLTVPYGDERHRVRFFPGTDFAPQERDTFFRVRFRNPLPDGTISSRYGYRTHPFTGLWSFHEGIDLAADFGTPVRTAARGQVRSIDRDPWLGLTVTVDHGNGYSSVYAHLQESVVRVGQSIEEGATIGFVGSTGLSTGPHLHFELRYRGDSKNPEQYLEWQ